MLKNTSRVLIIIAVIIFQFTIINYIRINEITANLFVVVIVSISILRGLKEGLTYALIFGLVQDILFGHVIGLNIPIYAAISIVTSFFYGNFNAESVVVPLAAIGLSDIGYSLCIYGLTYLLRGRIDIFYYSYRIIVPEAFYTVVVAIPVYRLLIIYSHFLDRLNDRNRKDELY